MFGLCSYMLMYFFFFKQKTAYEMRISDWSSDVCSSDLEHRSIVPNVFLVETAAPGSFRFKLNGEETIEMLGENPAGHLVREYSISHYGYDLEEYYQSVAASRRCWKCFGRLMAAGKEHYLFESIDCPLAAEDGSISHIIGVMEIVARLARPFPRGT